MSYFLTQRTPLTDESLLNETLAVLGFELKKFEMPAPVRGWGNEVLPLKCELVILRESSGKLADIGFHREQDGSFTIASDEFANDDLGAFIANVKRTYQELKAIRTAKSQGMRVVSRGKWVTRDGRRYLQLKVTR